MNTNKIVEVLRSEAKRHFAHEDEKLGDWDEHRVRRTAGYVLISLALAIEAGQNDDRTASEHSGVPS
jgi:hypothetical protein